ncbi:MAG: hypothetical protein BHW01_02190 [Clostridium sp. 27_14]|nr:MAG: hypothetical protein BHW01_02190 [Clostridium sp. 27_14]
MNLNNLYDLAEKEHIKIYDYYIEDAYGCFINIDKINAIALNYTNIDNSYIEKETLSEELGHYYQDATYSINCTDTTLINKQEYRAKKWSYYILIPFEKLKLAIKNRNQYSL